jgi:hypothetical protein
MRKDEVIGLIPCAGRASRISPLPCSKEVLPVGLRRTSDGSLRSKVWFAGKDHEDAHLLRGFTAKAKDDG